MKLTIELPDELADRIADLVVTKLQGKAIAPAMVVTYNSPTEAVTASTKPKTEAPKTEAPKTEAPKPEAPKTDAPKADAPKVLTAEAVRNFVITMKDKCGLDAAKAMLREVAGVDSPAKIPAEKFADVVEAAKKAIAAAEVA